MPDYRDDCDRISGGCGCSVSWVNGGGWGGDGAVRVNPPTSCRGNGQYCGPGSFEFSNPQNDIYIRFLVRFSANWGQNAIDCGLNKQMKFIISHPDTRGMVIFQNYYDSQGYTWAPCENTGCNWTSANRFNSSDHPEEWVSVEAHFDGNGNAVRIWIQTQDGSLTAVEGSPFSTQPANIGSPITNLEGLGQWFNGCFRSGTWMELSDVVIDTSYIGPPAGFGSGGGGTPNPQPDPTPQPDPDPTPGTNTGLPRQFDFEENNLSEWMGNYGDLVVTNQDPRSGQYAARATLTEGTHSDNYADFYFGDHMMVGGDKVEEVYVKFSTKFTSDYNAWPRASHKIALLNITDGQSSQRRYQVMVNVDNSGRYYVEHSYIDTWQFYGLAQNVGGTPASVRYGQWEDLKLYVRLNTPGSSNGIVKLWVNGVLKADYSNVNIRQNTQYGINKLILSSYATDQSVASGYQYYDDWAISTIDFPSDLQVVGSSSN